MNELLIINVENTPIPYGVKIGETLLYLGASFSDSIIYMKFVLKSSLNMKLVPNLSRFSSAYHTIVFFKKL
jgi:hypothetical protein